MNSFEVELEEFIIWIGSIPLPEFLEVMDAVRNEGTARQVRIDLQRDKRAS